MSRKTLASALLVALTSLALSGCDLAPSVTLEDARARLEKQDLAGAEIDLKSFLQKNPTSGEARYLLGKLLLDRGDAAGAVIELDRALDQGHDADVVVPTLATALLRNGKGSRVITDFAERSLTRPEARASLLATLASAYAQAGKKAEAGRAIDQAIAAAPKSEVALLARAKFTAVTVGTAEAMTLTDQLLTLHPNSEDGWALKGDLLMRDAATQATAIDAYRSALKANPKQVHARAALIALALTKGDLKAAETDLQLLREHSPKHFSTNFLDAQLSAAKGDHAKARGIYQAILKIAPDHPQVLVSAAENEFRLNDLAQAEVMASKALTLVPGSKAARMILANVHLRRNEAGKAVVILAPLAEREDATPDVLALTGQAQQRAGNAREAERMFKRLAAAKPTDPRLRTIVATAGGQDGSAMLSELQEIASEDAGISADLAIINTHLRARKFDDALKALDAIEKKQPGRPNPLVLRAQVLAQKGDLAEARRTLDRALGMDKDYLPALMALAALDLTEKKPDDARNRFKSLLERQPKNGTALMALAELSQRAGAPHSEIDQYLRRAVEVEPQSLRARLKLIDYQLGRGDHSAALSAANTAVAAMPDDAQLMQKLAQIQMRMGERDQALATYGKLTSMRPKAALGYVGQAQVYLALADYRGAERAIDKALEREPENLDAITLQVAAQAAQRQYPKAETAARQLQAKMGDMALGYVLESDIAAAQNDLPRAEKLLRQALDKRNPGTAPAKLHHVLMRQNRKADADKVAKDWTTRFPNDLSFAFYLADAAQQGGRFEEAEERYRAMLQVKPDQPIALNNLAVLLMQQKKPGAQALIDKALLTLPDEPSLLDTQGDVRAANGDNAGAIQSYTRAVDLAPRAAVVRLKLAKLLIATGERATAKAQLDRMVDAGARLNDAQREELRALYADLGKR